MIPKSSRGGIIHSKMKFNPGIISVKLMTWAAVLVISMMGGVGGDNYGPEYTSDPRYCERDADCHQSAGEVCMRSFKGCPRGKCSCDPTRSYRDTDGSNRCKTKLFGEEACDSDGPCPQGMLCYQGRCQCDQGRMTPDKRYCIKDDERLLGQTCHPLHHKCLQMSAPGIYTQAEVECTAALCQCKEGYRADGAFCRRWKIGEQGCSKDHQCQGGALCIDTYCRCPSGYLPEAGKTKCVKFGSTVGRSFGETCDEIGENLYCAEGLLCHQCIGQSQYVCVLFSESFGGGSVSSAHGSSPLLSQYFMIPSFLGLAIYTTSSCHR